MRNVRFSSVVAFLFLAIGVSASGESKLAPLKTVALIPLTGSSAEQGGWIRDGIQLGAQRAERDLGVSVTVTFEDTAAEPKTAMSAYQNLFSREAFQVFFTYGSGVGIALSPAANRDKTIQIGLATANPAYRSADDFTFRNFPSAELESQFLVESILGELKQTELAIIKIDWV